MSNSRVHDTFQDQPISGTLKVKIVKILILHNPARKGNRTEIFRLCPFKWCVIIFLTTIQKLGQCMHITI